MAEHPTSIDAAVRMSHRHLVTALGFVMLLGLAALLSFSGGDAGRVGKALWMALPLIMVIAGAALQRMNKRVDARALKAVRKDELRQASLSRAWRNGFFAVLGLQPVLALGLAWSGAGHDIAWMAAATATVGAGTVLVTLLWYDR
jgi:hypothetical protein